MDRLRILKASSMICGLLVTLLSLVFLISWHVPLNRILFLPPTIYPLPYTLALSLLISGIGIFAILSKKPTHIPNLAGGMIIVIAAYKVIGLFFDGVYPLDSFLNLWLPSSAPAGIPIAPISSFAYMLLGSLLLVWSRSIRTLLYNNIFLFASLVLTYMAILGMIASQNPIKSSLGWSSDYPLNFYSCVGVFLAGAGLIIGRFYYGYLQGINLMHTLPSIVTLSLLAVTIIFAMGVRSDKDYLVEDFLNTKANSAQNRILSHLKGLTGSFSRMAHGIEYVKALPDDSWEAEANLLLIDQNEIKSIALTNNELNILKIQPALSSKKLLQHPLLSLLNRSKESLDEAMRSQGYFAELYNDNRELALIYPLYWDASFQGTLIFSINLIELLRKALDEFIDSGLIIKVSHNDNLIYTLGANDQKESNRWKAERSIPIGNLSLQVILQPTYRIISETFSNRLIYISLIGGFLISVGIGMLLHLWQLAKDRIASIEESQKQLAKIKDDLEYTLDIAEIGTWVLEFPSNRIVWNDITYRLFGLKPNTLNTLEQTFAFVHPDDREDVEACIKASTEKGLSFACDCRTVWPDGSIHYLTSRGRPFFRKDGNPERMIGICWDISEIKKTQQFLQVSERISKCLSEAVSTAEAALKIRHILYRVFGWEIMIIWMHDQKSDDLKCLEISTFHELHIPDFEVYTHNHPLSRNETVPGQIISSHRPVWYKDYPKAVVSSRAKEVEKNGLKGFFAFPIFSGSSMSGLVELFKRDPFTEDVDEAFLNLSASIGIYLGQFIQRRASEEAKTLLASIVTYSSEGIYLSDLAGIIRTWNEGAESIYGWTKDEIVGKNVKMLYPEEKYGEYDLLLPRLRMGENILHFETQRKRKDGSIIWVSNTYSPIRNDANAITLISVITQEITQQKQTMLELQRSEEKFRAFVETTEEWIWEIDTNFKILYSNPAIQKFLGFTPQEVIGKELFIFIPEKYREMIRNEIQGFVKLKSGWKEQLYTTRHVDGTIKIFESNAVPVFNEKNQLAGFRGADRDVTERMNIEKSKSEFISVVSHELRTPLTSIHGALGLIKAHENLPGKIKELAGVAYRNSERLTHIINDILVTERGKLGQFEFQLKPVVIADTVRETLLSFIPMAEKFQIQLAEEDILPEIQVYADPERLIQVIANLISNAIKFSYPMGKVVVTMEKMDEFVRVLVSDQGIGIPKDFESRIFERFAQANSSDSRSVGGTGLGLNVCKNIVVQLGGKIGFRPNKGRGTTFYFDLPILQKDS